MWRLKVVINEDWKRMINLLEQDATKKNIHAWQSAGCRDRKKLWWKRILWETYKRKSLAMEVVDYEQELKWEELKLVTESEPGCRLESEKYLWMKYRNRAFGCQPKVSFSELFVGSSVVMVEDTRILASSPMGSWEDFIAPGPTQFW